MARNDGIQVLDPGVGYGIIIGIGGFFALMMLGLTWLQNRYTAYSTKSSEEFNTASRSVKPGLIASGIVSSWTWSATLLTSLTFSYSYGISGGMWYAAMGTWQILLFALIAIKMKASAPGAHTFPEIVLSRHGRIADVIYLFFGIATNMLVGACLVLGGSQVVSALSGVNVYAACFLIPLVVAAYVVSGDLHSTFIADYTHSAILFVGIFTFCFSICATNSVIGSPSEMYDLLMQASIDMPITGNHEGSYLTFKSNEGLVFAIDLFVAGFTTVWLDQSYWQRAIASRPDSSVKAYLFGGMAWYGIPFSFATAMGLGCAALTSSPDFPTYPNALSAAQNGAGLSSPATAIALLGKNGAGLLLLLLFMAVTSSTSAELIAVQDVHQTPCYIGRVGDGFTLWHSFIYFGFGGVSISSFSNQSSLTSNSFCSILNAASLNLTWLLTVLGVIVGGAALPVGLILLWPRMSTPAAIYSPILAFFAGRTAWLLVAYLRSGEITITSTGDVTNAMAGNLVSLGMGVILAVIFTFAFPRQAQFTDELSIARIDKINGKAVLTPLSNKDPTSLTEKRDAIPSGPDDISSIHIPPAEVTVSLKIMPLSLAEIEKATRLAIYFNLIFLFIAILLVPFTFFGTEWVFTREGFTGYCVVSFIWVWISMGICVVWPVIESWESVRMIFKGIWSDLRRRQRGREERDGGV